MNFFKKNTGITVGLVIAILIAGWLYWENLGVQSHIEDLKSELDDEKTTLEELKEKTFAITKENKVISEKNLAAIKGRIGGIKSALSAYTVKTTEMGKVEFQSYLHSSVDTLKKELIRKGISVNTKFQELSFKKIKEITNPTSENIKTGLTRLSVLKKIVEMLPEDQQVNPLAEVGIESIESIDWPEKGRAISKSGTISYTPLEIRIVGNQEAVRPFINKIVACKDIMLIIKSIEFKNPVSFGLTKPENKTISASTNKKEEEDKVEYKESREIVNNNKVDWTLYIDLIQTCDVKTTEEGGE